MVRLAVEAAAPGAPATSLPPPPPGVGGLSSHTCCCSWQIFHHRTRSLEQQSPEEKSKYTPSLQSTVDEAPVSEPFFPQPRGRESTGLT